MRVFHEHHPLEKFLLIEGHRINDLLDDQVQLVKDRNADDDSIAGGDDFPTDQVFAARPTR